MTTDPQPHHRDSSLQAKSINPYAVTSLPDRTSSPVAIAGQVSTQTLVISTIAGITASGACFGIVLMLAGMLTLDPSDANAVVLATSAIVGCFVAFFGALAIVPLMSTASKFVRYPASHWSAGGIHIFATTCGFLTGFLCIPLLEGGTHWSATAGLVPGTVGGIGTALAVIPLARRAKIVRPQYR